MQLYGVDKRDMNQAGVLKIFFSCIISPPSEMVIVGYSLHSH